MGQDKTIEEIFEEYRKERAGEFIRAVYKSEFEGDDKDLKEMIEDMMNS